MFSTSDALKVADTRISSKPRSQSKPLSHRAVARKHKSVQTDPVAESSFEQGGGDTSSPSKLVGLLIALKTRLGDLELDLDRLRQENEHLRHELAHCTNDEESRSAGAKVKIDENEELMVSTRDINDHECLHHSLQDRTRQISLLEARYDRLKERAHAKAALHKQSVNRIEQLSEQLFKVQQQLAEQTQTIQRHEDLALENDSLRREAHVLRSEIATLNDAIATLSSRPFNALSVDLQTKNVWIATLEEGAKALETKVAHAQQDARVAKQASCHLSVRVKQLQEEIKRQAGELEQCRLECEQHKMAREIAELQLRFYTAPEDKTLLSALGKAAKEICSQSDSASKLTSFLECTAVAAESKSSSSEADSVLVCARCESGLLS